VRLTQKGWAPGRNISRLRIGSIRKRDELIAGPHGSPGQASCCRRGKFVSLKFAAPAALVALLSFVAPACAQQHDLPEAPSPQSTPAQQSSQSGPETQSTTSVHGVVVNNTGAVCEGALVELDQPGINPPVTTTSNSNGRFDFPNPAPGPFKLTVTSSGFLPQVISGMLTAGQSLETSSIVLTMKGTTTEVDVTASREEVAEEQLHLEENQRVFGFFPNFYVTYDPHPAPLTTKQKFTLAWKSSIDPVNFAATGVIAGIEQATNSLSGYGQGVQGYAKRYGAGYADGFVSNMIGGAILPSWWKQDPRYFYKGTGTTRSRVLYAIAMAVLCKGDNGHWQVNYSGIIGGLAAGGVSNLYYPASNRSGAAVTFENAGFGTLESAVGNLFQEFLVKKFTPKIPNYSSGQP